MNDMTVGFIGPGIMGLPMALNLIKAGYTLAVYARRKEATEPLAQAGARVCDNPAEVGQQADIIFTIVSDTNDVEEVILGPQGLIHCAASCSGAGKIVVDMSTVSPTETINIAGKLADNGKAIIFVSSDLKELMAVCDRIMVMSAGTVAGIFDRDRWSRQKIMAAALSEYASV